MEIQLLWSFLMFCLIFALGILVLELFRPEVEAKVLLVFLENNEENVEAILRGICRKARAGTDAVQIVAVDNRSRDATVPIINRLQRYLPEIELVVRDDPRSMPPERLKLLLSKGLRVVDCRALQVD